MLIKKYTFSRFNTAFKYWNALFRSRFLINCYRGLILINLKNRVDRTRVNASHTPRLWIVNKDRNRQYYTLASIHD